MYESALNAMYKHHSLQKKSYWKIIHLNCLKDLSVRDLQNTLSEILTK